MKKFAVLAVILSLMVVSFPGAVAAQGFSPAKSATLYFVDGILSSSTIPGAQSVDVLLDNGLCLAQDVRFGQIVGPFNVAAGEYELLVVPSTANCEPKPVIARTMLSLGSGDNVSVVGLLSGKGEPILDAFVNFSSKSIGEGKESSPYLFMRNTSAASPLNVTAAEGKPRGARYAFLDLAAGEQAWQQASDGLWQVIFYQPSSFSDTTGYGAPVYKQQLKLELGQAYFFYAIGSLEAGSFTVIVQTLAIP